MLTHVPKNCLQPPRFDNHIGENDSGLRLFIWCILQPVTLHRLSCLYLIVPPGEEGESPIAAQYILKGRDDPMKIDVIQDRLISELSFVTFLTRLILYKSLEVKNSRTPAVREYYQLCFYIHGKLGS